MIEMFVLIVMLVSISICKQKYAKNVDKVNHIHVKQNHVNNYFI